MKIHDKYVIELKEVIKGYGNDPTVQDPCKFPCDYKFYEIDGVAICEKSFKKMTPLNDLVIKALEDVRAETERQYKWLFNTKYTRYDVDIAFNSIFRIIDKYRNKAESGDKE